MAELLRRDAEFLLYQTEDARTRVEVRLDAETARFSLDPMAALFQRAKSVISRYVKNVFDEGELGRSAVVARHAITAEDEQSIQGEMNREPKNGLLAEVTRIGWSAPVGPQAPFVSKRN